MCNTITHPTPEEQLAIGVRVVGEICMCNVDFDTLPHSTHPPAHRLYHMTRSCWSTSVAAQPLAIGGETHCSPLPKHCLPLASDPLP